MNKYSNAFTEVYAILNYLDEEGYNKIPTEVLEAVFQNRNTRYDYQLNKDLDLKSQLMLPETKAILFNLFRDYLSTPEQKEKIIRIQRAERRRNELRKQRLYDINVFKN